MMQILILSDSACRRGGENIRAKAAEKVIEPDHTLAPWKCVGINERTENETNAAVACPWQCTVCRVLCVNGRCS